MRHEWCRAVRAHGRDEVVEVGHQIGETFPQVPFIIRAVLAQALDQSLLTLERSRLHELLEFKQAELSEAESAGDSVARGRLQQDVLTLQRQRLALDRQTRDTTLLSQRRHIPPTDTSTATGGHP